MIDLSNILLNKLMSQTCISSASPSPYLSPLSPLSPFPLIPLSLPSHFISLPSPPLSFSSHPLLTPPFLITSKHLLLSPFPLIPFSLPSHTPPPPLSLRLTSLLYPSPNPLNPSHFLLPPSPSPLTPPLTPPFLITSKHLARLTLIS